MAASLLLSCGAWAQRDPVLPKDREMLDAQAGGFFDALRPAVVVAADSVVEVRAWRRRAAYGTVVSPGKVLTKWSEVADRTRSLACRVAGGKWLPAKVVGVYPDVDLAVLVIDGLQAEPLRMDGAGSPALGSFLALARPDGEAGAMGVVSVLPRSLRESDRAFLGVQMDLAYKGDGVRIDRVEGGTGAEQAGLRPGDVVVGINAMKTEGSFELSSALQRLRPGEEVRVKYRRGKDVLVATVILKGRPAEGRVPRDRMDSMNRMGGHRYSDVSEDFRDVIQTDMQLVPEDCGAPVVGLDGQVVGLAVARAGRIKSFVLPAAAVKELLELDPVDPGAKELAKLREPVGRPARRKERASSRETMRRHMEDMKRMMEDLENSGR